MSEWELVLPDGFTEYEWEVERKGWIEVECILDGEKINVIFYDLVRLGQEIKEELDNGNFFFEENLIVLRKVNITSMKTAISNFKIREGKLLFLN